MTLFFLGRLNIILVFLSIVVLLLIISCIVVFKFVSALSEKRKNSSLKLQSEPSLWWRKVQRELTENKRLVTLALLSAIIPIISATVGPHFRARQCPSFKKEIGDVAAAAEWTNNDQPPSFSVLSWNVLLGHDIFGRDNLPCVGQVLDVIQPDIIGMQESSALPPYWGGKDISSFLAGYLETSAYTGVNPKKATLGVDLLTKFRVVNHQSYLLPSNNERLPHYALVKISCVFMKRTIQIFNVHAVFKNWTKTESNPSPFANVSALQMQFIAQKVLESERQDPTIVMGDFNLNPYEPELDVFYDIGFKSALHEKRYRMGSSTISNRFAAIDHIFYRGLNLVAATTVSQSSNISDHFPVFARFQLLTNLKN